MRPVKFIFKCLLAVLVGFVLAVLIYILAVSELQGAEIQEIPVKDFSGGMVNSISNALMQPNQALVLENYDVTPFGNLTRRHGLRKHYVDSMTGKLGQGIFPYYGYNHSKSLLTVRLDSAGWFLSAAGHEMAGVFCCDDATSLCTTLVRKGLYLNRRHLSYPYNISSAIVNNNLVVAGTNSEMFVYDGEKSFPARPLINGQPEPFALDSIGTITGIVRYRYKYTNTGCADASTPSFPIKVTNGNVMITGMTPTGNLGDRINIYRQNNMEGRWYLVKGNLQTLSYYLDTMSIATSETKDSLAVRLFPNDTLTYDNDSCGPGGLICNMVEVVRDSVICRDEDDFLRHPWLYCHYPWGVQVPPNVRRDTCNILQLDSTPSQIRKPDSASYQVYSIMYQDSAGRYSYMTPPTVCKIVQMSAPYRTYYPYKSRFVDITNIPVPTDSAITKKYLMRMLLDFNERFIGVTHSDSVLYPQGEDWGYFARSLNKFLPIAEIDLASTTYTDSIPICPDPPSSPYFQDFREQLEVDGGMSFTLPADTCGDLAWNTCTSPYGGWDDKCAIFLKDDTVLNTILGYCNDDSIITFQPTSILSHGTRLFAIGDPAFPNAVYYSDFGRPTCWPSDKFINIASQKGDWLVGMVSMGDWLALFRQNSIVGLSGLSFFQYSIQSISNDVGLTAPGALAGSGQIVYFPHTSGVYRLPGNLDVPISFTIENSIDSVRQRLSRAWGRIVNGDYWLSVALHDSLLNEKTYIYSAVPSPHWKCYDMGILSGDQYDYGTQAADYRTTRYLFLLANDTIYDWNYADTTLDDTSHIRAVYQSKYLLDEGADRKKVIYVDLLGTGNADSLIVTLYDRQGEDTVFCDTVSVDFAKNERHRIVVDEIVTNASVRIEDLGYGDYTLSGYIMGFVPWDTGRKR
jgi:hypothetical protein